MKKVDIALLVMAGALAGALVMRLVQRPAEMAIRHAPVAPPVSVLQPEQEVLPASDAKPAAALEEKADEPADTSQANPGTEETPRAVKEPARVKKPVQRLRTTHRIAPPVMFAETPRSMHTPTERTELATQAASEASRSAVPTQAPTTLPVTPEQPKETPPARMEPENATPVPAPFVPQPNQATLNAGILIPVRLLDGLSSERNQAGDVFAATLDRELVASGFVVAERGARVEGRVTAADRYARTLSIELISVHTSDDQDVSIQTERFNKQSEPDRSGWAIKIGGGAVIGAVIGGVAGGGKGAALGTAAGGGIGAGDVALTRRAASLPSEIRVTFRLRAPVTITERAQ